MAEWGDQIHYGNAKAENDLSTFRYCFVELSGADQVDLCDATTDVVFGVLQDKPQANEAADVVISGITKCRAGATITAGNEISTTTSGNATGAGSTSGTRIVGQAITAAASGGYFALRLYNAPGLILDT
jgi:hypothetical protein